jgi:hypothetical protein
MPKRSHNQSLFEVYGHRASMQALMDRGMAGCNSLRARALNQWLGDIRHDEKRSSRSPTTKRELLERRNSRVYAFPVSSEIADPFQVAGIEEISKSVICG